MSEDQRFRDVNNYAGVHGFAAGFPNFHQADYGLGQVNGTILLSAAEVEWRDVAQAEYGVSTRARVPDMFRAANDYAGRQGYAAAFPNFHQANYGNGVVYGTILIKPGVTEWRDVPRDELGVYHIDDVGGMMRAANDYASAQGFAAGFPTFHQADYGNGVVCGIVLFNAGQATWRDVPAELLSRYGSPVASPWAIILGRLTDVPPLANARQRYVDYFTGTGGGTGGAWDYWRDMSYGLGGLHGSTVFGWFDLLRTRTQLAQFSGGAQRQQIFQWGIAAATANGVNLAAYPHKIVILNVSADHGKAPGGVVLAYEDTRALEPTFFFHEMGHEFGLDHSFGENPNPCAGGDARPGAYCDGFDIMSAMAVVSFQDAQNRRSGPSLNALSRERLGWLHRSRVWSHAGPDFSESLTLAAANRPDADGYLVAKIAARSRDPNQLLPSSYTFELRLAAGWDQGFGQNLVLVHEVRTDNLVRLATNLNGGFLQNGINVVAPVPDLMVSSGGIDTTTATVALRLWDLPNGGLRKEDSTPQVYLIQAGGKRWITSPAALFALGNSWSDVRVVPDGALASLPNGPNIDFKQLRLTVTPFPVQVNKTVTVTVRAFDQVTNSPVPGEVRVDGQVAGTVGVPITRIFRTRRVLVPGTYPREWEVIYPAGEVRATGYPNADIDFGFP